MERKRQMNKSTDRQSRDRHTNAQKYNQTNIQTVRQTNRQTDCQTDNRLF